MTTVKRGVLLSIGLLIIIFYINGCGIMNYRATDPGLENDAGAHFRAHDNRGEGFGLWNQQRDRQNPIANMVTRDERPGRGMNGIVDRTPNEMNRRISRFEAEIRDRSTNPNLKGLDQQGAAYDKNMTEQITQQILSIDTVRDARVIHYQNQLLIAVDSEAQDTQALKQEVEQYVQNKFPHKEPIVITDRRAVDRVRYLNYGFRSGRRNEDYDVQLREFVDEVNEDVIERDVR